MTLSPSTTSEFFNEANPLSDDLKLAAAAQRKLERMKRKLAFDPFNLDSRPTPAQVEAFKAMNNKSLIVVSGGNQSGKSLFGLRNVAYFFTRDHPYIDLDKRWPDQPLVILVLVQNSSHFDEHLKRIVAFCDSDKDYRVEKQGSNVKSVTHLKTGSKIIPYSYENAQAATKRIQMYSAVCVWIDELCDHLSLYEEASRRIQKNKGILLCTYTQKRPAPQVKKFLEAETPYTARFKFSALANPAYDEEAKARIMASLNALPIEIRAKKMAEILEGEYTGFDEYVYGSYDPDLHCEPLPEGYHPSWRHAEAVDPAGSGKTGYVLAAQHPGTQVWHVIRAKYFEAEAPSDLVEKIIEEGRGVNIVHRVIDPAASHITLEAAKKNLWFLGVNKKNRKYELIKGPSEAWKAGWLKLTPNLEFLEAEIGEAKWSADGTEVINSSKFHLIDSLQYLVDTVPALPKPQPILSVTERLFLADKKRREAEAKKPSTQQRFQITPNLIRTHLGRRRFR